MGSDPARNVCELVARRPGMRDATTPRMLMPSVSRYMTAKPITILQTATIGDAQRMMRDHAIRHLPVTDAAGNLSGLVSQRDLQLIESVLDVDPDTICVEDAMVEQPFLVTSDAALDEVVEIMAEQKYGSVVVMGRDGVEGIFTSVDVCRAFTDLLRRATA